MVAKQFMERNTGEDARRYENGGRAKEVQDNEHSNLEVIGIGLGRTGTRSLKAALEQLGYSPCYHLLDVFTRPWIIPIWLAVGKGGDIDWHRLFRYFRAGVDYPFTTCYPQVLEAYPSIKVVLTVREPESWYTSARETIYPLQAVVRRWLPGGKQVGDTTVWRQVFHERFEDREYAVKAYLRHNEIAQTVVPGEKLLVFDVREGWGPLCEFLGVPVPEGPFPHANRRRKFRLTSRLIAAGSAAALIVILAVLTWFILQYGRGF